MSTGTAYPVGTIAKLFNLTERRVQQLSKEGVIPKTAQGRYELVPAVQGYVRYLQERALGQQPAEGAIDYHAEKARKTRAEADLAEMDAALRRGELIEAAMVGSSWQAVMREIQSKLLGQTPARIASLVIGERAEGTIKKIIRAELVAVLEAASTADVDALVQGARDGGSEADRARRA
ncbi:hypothetical protein [Paracoccus homiensis]|uniref:Phage DNA packaging protein, Nu1 subunit of terminase n=1 Tax=Paracoccus homiensis TaxID=364199 RepID=A0A1H9YAZ0_9RHOB|nr:hypothetical protein [Paracoccus homiensis]SES66017.1 Phage DNA packaging protein, Nu1 subunit of terminase [Paracoccus homiensis]